MFLRLCSPDGKNTSKKLLLYVFKNASCYYYLIPGCYLHFKPRGKCQPAFHHISSTAAPQLSVLGMGGHGYIFFSIKAWRREKDGNDKQYVSAKAGLITAEEVMMAGIPLNTGSKKPKIKPSGLYEGKVFMAISFILNGRTQSNS